MGRNIEADYSHIFSIVSQLKDGQNPLSPLAKEKLETLLTQGEEVAGYYKYWETAKFGWLGRKDNEELRQGYLGKVKEFQRLKESYMGIAPKEDSTSQQTEEPSLESRLPTGQTQQKDPWVLVVKYKGERDETRIPVPNREVLIQQFREIGHSIIDDKRMEYLGPDRQYHKVNDPNQLPKKAG